MNPMEAKRRVRACPENGRHPYLFALMHAGELEVARERGSGWPRFVFEHRTDAVNRSRWPDVGEAELFFLVQEKGPGGELGRLKVRARLPLGGVTYENLGVFVTVHKGKSPSKDGGV